MGLASIPCALPQRKACHSKHDGALSQEQTPRSRFDADPKGALFRVHPDLASQHKQSSKGMGIGFTDYKIRYRV